MESFNICLCCVIKLFHLQKCHAGCHVIPRHFAYYLKLWRIARGENILNNLISLNKQWSPENEAEMQKNRRRIITVTSTAFSKTFLINKDKWIICVFIHSRMKMPLYFLSLFHWAFSRAAFPTWWVQKKELESWSCSCLLPPLQTPLIYFSSICWDTISLIFSSSSLLLFSGSFQ